MISSLGFLTNTNIVQHLMFLKNQRFNHSILADFIFEICEQFILSAYALELFLARDLQGMKQHPQYSYGMWGRNRAPRRYSCLDMLALPVVDAES